MCEREREGGRGIKKRVRESVSEKGGEWEIETVREKERESVRELKFVRKKETWTRKPKKNLRMKNKTTVTKKKENYSPRYLKCNLQEIYSLIPIILEENMEKKKK